MSDGHDSPEVFTFKEGTIVDCHKGPDTYIKAIVSEVHRDDATVNSNCFGLFFTKCKILSEINTHEI